MPTYEYRCNGCDKVFSITQSMSEHEKGGTACPECGGTEVVQLVSSFTPQTSKKS